MEIGLSLSIVMPRGGGDSTPGGAASALLLEDGTGILLESSDYLLLEA